VGESSVSLWGLRELKNDIMYRYGLQRWLVTEFGRWRCVSICWVGRQFETYSEGGTSRCSQRL
jgi:hypothetical protein